MADRPESYAVVVIGGGFCGAMTAFHLLLEGAGPVALVERRRSPGLGAAYGTEDAAHLLNVPAGDMSAFEGDPEHFLRWLRRQDPDAHAGTFAPRRSYGAYLGEILREAPAGLETIRDSAVGLTVSGAEVRVALLGGRQLVAERVVLALGNFPPGFPVPGSPEPAPGGRYIADPWSPALERIGAQDSVLLIGTGLTMADVVVSLAKRGHRGPLRAVSRHGLLPQPHRPAGPARDPWNGTTPMTARQAVKCLRDAAALGWADGSDWRGLFGWLRTRTQEVWSLWSLEERGRFLRHLRPYWDAHRHRLPPQVHSLLEDLMRSGQLSVSAARVLALEARPDCVAATLRPRHDEERLALRFQWAINCTGPEPALRKTSDPLMRGLLSLGLARPDALGLGLDADESGALLDADGRPSAALFTLGPALKARLWETTAVPDLRGQTQVLARRLARSRAETKTGGMT